MTFRLFEPIQLVVIGFLESRGVVVIDVPIGVAIHISICARVDVSTGVSIGFLDMIRCVPIRRLEGCLSALFRRLGSFLNDDMGICASWE